jgi:hypothetical protein
VNMSGILDFSDESDATAAAVELRRTGHHVALLSPEKQPQFPEPDLAFMNVSEWSVVVEGDDSQLDEDALFQLAMKHNGRLSSFGPSPP